MDTPACLNSLVPSISPSLDLTGDLENLDPDQFDTSLPSAPSFMHPYPFVNRTCTDTNHPQHTFKFVPTGLVSSFEVGLTDQNLFVTTAPFILRLYHFGTFRAMSHSA